MKKIALDIGNVLCHVAAAPFLDILSETFDVDIPTAARFLKRFQQLHDLGYTTMEDELKDHFNVKSPIIIKNLVQAWNDSVTPNLAIIDKMNELRDKHQLQVALLSNIGIEHAAMMKHKLSQGGFFDSSIKHFSCFVGARKPSTIFYQSFLHQYPDFKGCLYLDDLQENLTTSEAFGFKTFCFNLENPNYNDLIPEIEDIIVNG